MIRGAVGAVRSSVTVTGAEAALRRSERYPSAVLAVCVAVTVSRASAPPRTMVHRPSAPTVAVRSADDPDTESVTVEPAWPVPLTGPFVVRDEVTTGGTTTSTPGCAPSRARGSSRRRP